MKLLVVGGGGREHAIIRALKKNSQVETIYALPGNGGIARDAECVAIGATDIDKIVAFAVEKATPWKPRAFPASAPGPTLPSLRGAKFSPKI